MKRQIYIQKIEQPKVKYIDRFTYEIGDKVYSEFLDGKPGDLKYYNCCRPDGNWIYVRNGKIYNIWYYGRGEYDDTDKFFYDPEHDRYYWKNDPEGKYHGYFTRDPEEVEKCLQQYWNWYYKYDLPQQQEMIQFMKGYKESGLTFDQYLKKVQKERGVI